MDYDARLTRSEPIKKAPETVNTMKEAITHGSAASGALANGCGGTFFSRKIRYRNIPSETKKDDGKTLIRAQVKYANGMPSHANGAVVVKLEYESRAKKIFTYQEGEVDALIVYIPQVDKLCFFPKNVFVGKRKLSIRITPSKNNQKAKIVAAEDYYW